MKIYIKQYREAAGMSLSELAKKSAVAVSTISDIEHEKKCPTLNTLCKIAKALGANAKDLFDC